MKKTFNQMSLLIKMLIRFCIAFERYHTGSMILYNVFTDFFATICSISDNTTTMNIYCFKPREGGVTIMDLTAGQQK